ncbi:hypothetical protein EDD37DRAFT_651665 [Exophiala viscosa]|uniref:Uncharacterized protein n=1 Tax=Exophiala viscosa TaxID=2486360 RepID=A0AAN6DXJ5_9EURO|nr:hypothetical protein EDD36DRAFT_215345 [Exophiala viscosa]KAI1622386.1 hypothetical protein EDD37DRAFT_651665 [Exophiala viscosa]
MASSAPSTRKPPHLEIPPSPLERPKANLTRTNTHRLPPPALFQGPPSKNASHVSLALPGGDRPAGAETEHSLRPPRPSRVPAAASFSGPSLRQPTTEADDRRAENLWVEMQKTLADVEVSAMNTSHVFGASHAKALEDLRTAQLSLAQTWAKSEADELHEHEHDITADSATIGGKIEAGASPVKGKNSDGKPSAFTNNKNLEEETERDIQLARKRREANDRYFEQVNRGVLDVVSKLDEVAGAMRRVERESREIWDESTEDDLSASETGSATDHTGMTDSPIRAAKPR